jgi:hypothetical protein
MPGGVKMGDVVRMGKAVKLNVLERLTLNGLLPKEGSFMNLKLLRLTKEDLSFNEEENKALQFRTENQMIIWNNIVLKNKETGDIVKAPSDVLVQMATKEPEVFETLPACPDKEFIFGEVIEKLIIKALKDLDKAEKITEEHYSLYEKFMEGHEE